MASTPSPNDLTRQQLDELDTLLQRMLTLPLSSPGGPPTATLPPPPMPSGSPPAPSAVTGNWRTDGASPGRVPYFAGDPAMVPLAPSAPGLAALARTPEAPAPTWGPDPLARGESSTATLEAPSVSVPLPATTGTLRGVDAPALPADFRPTRLPEPILPPAPEAFSAPAGPATAEVVDSGSVPLPLWPVFGLNWVLELVFGLFGPFGSFLTHPFVKHVLAVVGFLLMVAAGLWSAQAQGWIVLPWPK